MVFLYNLLLFILSPFYIILNSVFKRKIEFLEKRSLEKHLFSKNYDINHKIVVWFHASSVGELDQCKSLILTFRSRHSDLFVLQSVTSNSVSDKNLNNELFDLSFHLPLDFPFAYKNIIHKFRPKFLIISAWDLWPNLIVNAKKQNCKVFLTSAVFNKNSGRYKNFLLKSLTSAVLQKLDGISTSNVSLNEVFKELAPNVKIESCGDSRFDSVIQKIELNSTLDKIFPEQKKSYTLILASTYNECDTIIFPILKEILKLDFQIWIFPHKIHRERIEEVKQNLSKHNLEFGIYSDIHSWTNQIIIFDTMGILAFAYSKGTLVYVGGGFHNRIHNTIEPAYFGLPIATGTRIQHAPEAIEMEKMNLLTTIKNSAEFIEFTKIAYSQEIYNSKHKELKEYVQKKKGASDRFYKFFIEKEIL
jgi:3-deoxy-D-manno-octulosonic-acid transferase